MIPTWDPPARRGPGHAARQRAAVRAALEALLADPSERALVVEALMADHGAREMLVAALGDRRPCPAKRAALARFTDDPAYSVAHLAGVELALATHQPGAGPVGCRKGGRP